MVSIEISSISLENTAPPSLPQSKLKKLFKPEQFLILLFYSLHFYFYFLENKQMFLPEINFGLVNFLAFKN